MSVFVPYCGAPPVPGSESWNFDPKLIAGLALCALYVYRRSTLASGAGASQKASALAGMVVLALAFVSPLCNVSVALFSARAAQHMLLTLVAAPLIAAGLIRAGASLDGSVRASAAVAATLLFAGVFWIWHTSVAYDETLRNNVLYWLMHVSTIGAALILWLVAYRSSGLVAFLVVTATGVQMSLLGAVLTFAGRPLYSVHALTTSAWGLTWLQDQQLGGLLMWVPAGLLLTLYSVVALGSMLSRMNAAERALLESVA
ncbi:MAG TPA: cytochrome c oxidase assembly protein [Roseiarcus sp.]|nr:cytochrome c oxidase assembly protein [Roseiarcus sp.]